MALIKLTISIVLTTIMVLTIQSNKKGEGRGHTINVPLDEGLCDDDMIDVYRSVTTAVLDAIKPDVILMQCGVGKYYYLFFYYLFLVLLLLFIRLFSLSA